MSKRAKPVKVAALGMEQRTYSTLQLFFKGHCDNNYVLSEEDSADISIIDMDGFQAAKVYEGHKKDYPDRPTITISLADLKQQDSLHVKKPVQFSSLTSALGQLSEKLNTVTPNQYANPKPFFEQGDIKTTPPVLEKVVFHDFTKNKNKNKNKNENEVRPTTSSSDKTSFPSYASLDSLSYDKDLEFLFVKQAEVEINPHSPSQMAKLQYQPAQLLQSYLKEAYELALESESDVTLEGPWRTITILHKSRQISVNENYRHLFALSSMSFSRQQVRISLLSANQSFMSLRRSVQPIELFLWKLAIRSSRGRVPIGTDFKKPIKLKRWPNFTRSIVTPHALRIAALWTKHPTSLLKTAEILSISLRYVLVFYSAAVALDLITNPSHVEKLGKASKIDSKPTYKKLFQGFLNRLRSY